MSKTDPAENQTNAQPDPSAPEQAAPSAPKVPPPPAPSKSDLQVLRYCGLSGLAMTKARVELDAALGHERVEKTLAQFVANGVCDAGHVLTAKGKAALSQYGG